MQIEVDSDYGYCILIAVASQFVLIYMGVKVGGMRKKTGITYPQMYSDKDKLFNCYQRAHQNTLENYAQFLTLLLLGGFYCPCVNACAGAVYLFSRLVYAWGYYTGNPKNRMYSAFGYLGLIAMAYNTVRLAGQILGWF